MENLSEYIVPILVFIYWVVSIFFKKKSPDENDSAPPTVAPRPIASDDDAIRRIQEEIQRLARERRASTSEDSTATQSQMPQPIQRTPPPLPEKEPHYDVTKPYHQQKYPAQEYQKQSEASPSYPTQNEAPVHVAIDYAQQIAAAKEQAEIAKTKLNEARIKSINASASHRAKTAQHSTNKRSNTIFATLSSPNGLRNAFLLKEIIGSPVALQKQGNALWH